MARASSISGFAAAESAYSASSSSARLDDGAGLASHSMDNSAGGSGAQPDGGSSLRLSLSFANLNRSKSSTLNLAGASAASAAETEVGSPGGSFRIPGKTAGEKRPSFKFTF